MASAARRIVTVRFLNGGLPVSVFSVLLALLLSSRSRSRSLRVSCGASRMRRVLDKKFGRRRVGGLRGAVE